MAVWGPFSFLSGPSWEGRRLGLKGGTYLEGYRSTRCGAPAVPRGAQVFSYFFNANLVFEKAQRRPTVGVQRSIFAPDCWLDLKS